MSSIWKTKHELGDNYGTTYRCMYSQKFKTLPQLYPCRFLREKSQMRNFRLPWIPHTQGHIIQEEMEGQQIGVCACVRAEYMFSGWTGNGRSQLGRQREERWPPCRWAVQPQIPNSYTEHMWLVVDVLKRRENAYFNLGNPGGSLKF